MLDIFYSAKFKKDYKRIVKQGRDTEILFRVVALLANEQPLPAQYKDHALTGGYGGHRECHLQPDWPLIYNGARVAYPDSDPHRVPQRPVLTARPRPNGRGRCFTEQKRSIRPLPPPAGRPGGAAPRRRPARGRGRCGWPGAGGAPGTPGSPP